jgi:GNAT superfamily N-acetyltransferase
LLKNFENIMEIRKTCPQDVPQILEFIKGIARYEKMENEVIATESKLHEWLFEKQVAQVVFAEVEGKAVGFALFFHKFSTFVDKAGIYLEDLYVMPEYRGKGYGKALF